MTDTQPLVYVVTVEQYYANYFSVVGAFTDLEKAKAAKDKHIGASLYAFRGETEIDLEA